MTEKQHTETAMGRRRILFAKMLLLLAALVFVAELAVFLLFGPYELISGTLSKYQYFLYRAIVPLGINLLTAAGCFCFQKSGAVPKNKNIVLVTAASLICLNVCLSHPMFVSALGVFCIPVVISVLSGNRRLINYACVLNILFLIAALIDSYSRMTQRSPLFLLVAVFPLGILLSVYLLGTVLIDYNREIQQRIVQDYQVQQVLKRRASSDPLTKLNNQNAYRTYVEKAIQEESREGCAVLLAILDVDDFKKVNDTYGHSAGNEVLVALAQELQHCFSGELEFTARYGGEEFVIVFRHSDWQLVAAKLEAFRISFSERRFGALEGNSVTFSVGAAALMPGERSATQLFDRADMALYKAKEKGKNRTIFYAEDAK